MIALEILFSLNSMFLIGLGLVILAVAVLTYITWNLLMWLCDIIGFIALKLWRNIWNS